MVEQVVWVVNIFLFLWKHENYFTNAAKKHVKGVVSRRTFNRIIRKKIYIKTKANGFNPNGKWKNGCKQPPVDSRHLSHVLNWMRRNQHLMCTFQWAMCEMTIIKTVQAWCVHMSVKPKKSRVVCVCVCADIKNI